MRPWVWATTTDRSLSDGQGGGLAAIQAPHHVVNEKDGQVQKLSEQRSCGTHRAEKSQNWKKSG